MTDVVRYTPVALLGVGCLLISGIREQQRMPSREPMKAVAVQAPGYTVTDVVVKEQERRIAGMSDYMFRAFQRDSLDAGFSVYVGYYDYQVQGKTIHSPKNCLPGAGWEQLSSSVQTVNVGGTAHPVNRYILANKGAQAMVYYWYQGRGRTEANEYKVKWHLLRDAAIHGRTEEALVRIVVPLERADTRREPQRAYARADSLLQSLATQLIPNVERVLPTAPGV
jgi:EpsI family protein